MNDKIKYLIETKRSVVQELEDAILNRMVFVAGEYDIDEMSFNYENVYRRQGMDVECQELDELDRVYCEEIRRCGFLAAWSKDKGWK